MYKYQTTFLFYVTDLVESIIISQDKQIRKLEYFMGTRRH